MQSTLSRPVFESFEYLNSCVSPCGGFGECNQSTHNERRHDVSLATRGLVYNNVGDNSFAVSF